MKIFYKLPYSQKIKVADKKWPIYGQEYLNSRQLLKGNVILQKYQPKNYLRQ